MVLLYFQTQTALSGALFAVSAMLAPGQMVREPAYRMVSVGPKCGCLAVAPGFVFVVSGR
jgi:hypothetical protein